MMKRIHILPLLFALISALGFSVTDGQSVWTKNVLFCTEVRADVFCPGENVWNNGAQFPTVIALADSEKLLTTFEVFDKGKTYFRIMESADGSNWTEIATVTETMDDSLQAAWNPCLLELPESVGALDAGTVLLAAVSIDPTQKVKSQISLYAGTDNARSWTEIAVIQQGGGIDEGVWEPYLVYEDGYIYCFYSDDADPVSSQTIVYQRSKDCLHWEDKVLVVRSQNPDERPGMPVLTRMGNGKYFLCYEFGCGDGYPVYAKTTDSVARWDESDIGTKVQTTRHKTIGSAPSCVWIPDGGANGTLIVSGKYGNSRDNDLFISHDYGKTFRSMKNPLPYSDLQGAGYRASFFYTRQGKLLYANAVDYEGKLTKISFVRIRPQERWK